MHQNRDLYALVKEKMQKDGSVISFTFYMLRFYMLQTGAEIATIEQVRETYEEFHPDYPFDFRCMDTDYQGLYASELKVAMLSTYFAMLAILISCLDLFGLAAFITERRSKEIGIRKILGASEWSIVSLLSRDFSKMVLLAILIAVPISYLIAQRWLETFAYKIDLAWWFFALALLFAWLTVGVQTFRAARANPMERMRRE